MRHPLGFSVVLVIASAILCSEHALLADQPLDGPLQQALAAVKTQEDALRYISITAGRKTESLDSKSNKLEFESECQLKAIYDSEPRGKCRIDVARSVNPWTNGPSPFYLMAYVIAYNGRTTEFYQTKTGDFQNPSPDHSGTIDGKRGTMIQALAFDTGWDESVFGGITAIDRREAVVVRFSEILANPKLSFSFETAEVDISGIHYLQVTRTEGYGKQVILLDPAKAYSIVQEDTYLWKVVDPNAKNKKLVPSSAKDESCKITEFWELAPHVFYPKRVEWQSFSPDHGDAPVRVSHVVISAAKLEPSVDPTTFEIQFPKGARVVDKTTDEEVLIGGTPEEQQAKIDAAVSAAHHAAATAPAPADSRR